MSDQSMPFVSPELKRSGKHQLVDVPAGKAEESIELQVKTCSHGFFFNGYKGCDQSTFDRVLSLTDPQVVGIAGFPNIRFDSLYARRKIEKLVIGDATPWPDFSRVPSIVHFTAMEIRAELSDLPLSLISLDLYGYKESNLSCISAFTQLRKLRLAAASRIVDLYGIPRSVKDLELAKCNKLASISDIEECTLTRLFISGCKRINDVGPIARQTGLRELTLSNLGVVNGLNLIDLSSLEFAYTGGTIASAN